MNREDFIRNNTVEEIGKKEFLNSLLFAINEMRADDIGKIIENNPDFINLIRDINKNTKGEDNYNLERAIFKIVNLVQNIAYIEGFKDGFNFFNDILNQETNIVCYNCRGVLREDCSVCGDKGFIKVNNFVNLIEQFIKNGDI
jgi:hypothetical protein